MDREEYPLKYDVSYYVMKIISADFASDGIDPPEEEKNKLTLMVRRFLDDCVRAGFYYYLNFYKNVELYDTCVFRNLHGCTYSFYGKKKTVEMFSNLRFVAEYFL